jgi:hypothetical protein
MTRTMAIGGAHAQDWAEVERRVAAYEAGRLGAGRRAPSVAADTDHSGLGRAVTRGLTNWTTTHAPTRVRLHAGCANDNSLTVRVIRQPGESTADVTPLIPDVARHLLWSRLV